MRIKIDEVIKILNSEIQWCIETENKFGLSDDYISGFIKGLEQAKYLILKANDTIKVGDSYIKSIGIARLDISHDLDEQE